MESSKPRVLIVCWLKTPHDRLKSSHFATKLFMLSLSAGLGIATHFYRLAWMATHMSVKISKMTKDSQFSKTIVSENGN
jgi:hypothetical protein